MTLKHRLDQFCDFQESNLSREEEGDRLFICSHKHTGIGASALCSFEGQSKAGEACYIQRFKIESRYLRPIQLGHKSGTVGVQAHGIAQRILYWQMHAWKAGLHFQRTINKLDHRVDDTFWVDDDVDAVIWNTKKPVGFEYLQAFIHQRRRVYGNFRPHA